jgi:murein DD-endopeptidase MepM/ murein hydrolase activator NlpD
MKKRREGTMKKSFKKSLVTTAFLGFSLIARFGFAAIPQDNAAEEIDQAHTNLTVASKIMEAVSFVMSSYENEAHQPEMLPCEGKITSDFGFRHWGKRMKMHEGIDIGAPVGTVVKAPAAGTVIFVGSKRGYGKTVMIDHGGSIQTLFAHNSKLLVKEGDKVNKGDIISLTGNSGHSTGPHLHYEVLKGGEHVDPAAYI